MATWTSPTSGMPMTSIQKSWRTSVLPKPIGASNSSCVGWIPPQGGLEGQEDHPSHVGHARENAPSDPAHWPEQTRGWQGVRGRAHGTDPP